MQTHCPPPSRRAAQARATVTSRCEDGWGKEGLLIGTFFFYCLKFLPQGYMVRKQPIYILFVKKREKFFKKRFPQGLVINE